MSDAIGIDDIGVNIVGNDTQPQDGDSEIQNVMTNASKLLGAIIARPNENDDPPTTDAIEPVMRQSGELISDITKPATDENLVGEVTPDVIDDTIEPFMAKALELINQIIEPTENGFTKEDLLRLILNNVVELKEPYSTIDQIMEAARQLTSEITKQPESVDNDRTIDQTMEAAQQLASEIATQPESVDNDSTIVQTMEAARQLAIEITKQPESVPDTENIIDKTLKQSVDLLAEILSPEEVVETGTPWKLSGFKMTNPLANITFFEDRANSEHIDINEYDNENNKNKINTHINGNAITIDGKTIEPEHTWWKPLPPPPTPSDKTAGV